MKPSFKHGLQKRRKRDCSVNETAQQPKRKKPHGSCVFYIWTEKIFLKTATLKTREKTSKNEKTRDHEQYFKKREKMC
jgi:hypothetical protein